MKYAKIAAVLALAMGAPLAFTATANAAPYHDSYDHRGDHRDFHNAGNFDGGRHFDNGHRSYRGHWEFRNHRWQWQDGFWFGR
ncbi:MAG TPA: hypothetical protein VGG48_13480 [Rhizomicrobium sp.]|jgi:hypothetical protein